MRTNLYDRLTDEQVKIILDGVKNDVDYKDIAKAAGLTNRARVTEFLQYRMIGKFLEAKESRAASE